MLIGSKLYYFDSVDSTNQYAKLIIKDAADGTVVLADEQTEGKGRGNKKWYSPVDGIWMSVILTPPDFNLISTMAAVAVCTALHINEILTGIKWPNDILLNGKKIGGILTEIMDNRVVIGIGVNLNIRKFPPELGESASSVFIETKKHLDTRMVFNLICRQLDNCYQLLLKNQIEELLTEWRHYSLVLGQSVTVEQATETLRGRVLDIDRTGALVIQRQDGKIQRVVGGACHFMKGTVKGQ